MCVELRVELDAGVRVINGNRCVRNQFREQQFRSGVPSHGIRGQSSRSSLHKWSQSEV